MKKTITAAGVILLLLIPIGVYYQVHRLGEPKTNNTTLAPLPKELREMERALAAGAQPSAKGPISATELPKEIVATLKQVLPNAAITEANRDKKDKLKLKLAWEGKTGSAKLKLGDNGVSGEISENLKPGDLPSAIAEAYKKVKPDGAIDKLRMVTQVGGGDNGQAIYEWEFGDNADAEASADGKSLTLKEEVAASNVPQAVIDAANKAFPGGNLDDKAERINENGEVSYAFDVRPADGGQKVEIIVTANGQVQRK